MFDDIPDDRLREWVIAYVRIFDGHMDQIKARLDALTEGSAVTQSKVSDLSAKFDEMRADYAQFTPSLQPSPIHITVDLSGLTKREVVVKFLHEYPEHKDKTKVSARDLGKAIQDKFDFTVTPQYAHKVRDEELDNDESPAA